MFTFKYQRDTGDNNGYHKRIRNQIRPTLLLTSDIIYQYIQKQRGQTPLTFTMA